MEVETEDLNWVDLIILLIPFVNTGYVIASIFFKITQNIRKRKR